MTLLNKDPEHLLKDADMINGGRGEGRLGERRSRDLGKSVNRMVRCAAPFQVVPAAWHNAQTLFRPMSGNFPCLFLGEMEKRPVNAAFPSFF